jgi:3-dehydroquinate synthetase
VKPEKLYVGAGMRLRANVWGKDLCTSSRVALISEPQVWKRFGSEVRLSLKKAGFDVSLHLLPTGEAAKSWAVTEKLMADMLMAGLGRDGAVVALGGGAVTDTAGFAAAIYLRGIPWVSMPTTLLGQLDSGLGGKTGVNLRRGKNLAGAFHRPLAVVCDSDVLASLPVRERISGFGEALKYGLVFDPGLWRLMRSRWSELIAGQPDLVAQVVRRGAQWKCRVVARDEFETKGPRELLNFGHTLGFEISVI